MGVVQPLPKGGHDIFPAKEGLVPVALEAKVDQVVSQALRVGAGFLG